MTNENGLSPADFAAMTNGNGSFGNSWWIIILFLFFFCGFGGNGYGGGAAENYVLASDFATLQRQIDSAADRIGTQNVAISNGLCEGFYTQAQLINGVNMGILSGNNETNRLIENGFANTNYNMATNCCGINNSINNSARDIIEAQNAGTRSILDAINQNKIDAMKERIDEQNAQINALNLAASQAAQNNYLIGQLRPAPIPAYQVTNPYNYGGCGCGC